MRIFNICWEDVTEEAFKKCFAKTYISAKDHTQAQNDLDDKFIVLRSNMERLKSLGFDEFSKDLAPEDFANLDDTVATTETVYLMS